MAKRRSKIDTNQTQMSLLDYLQQSQEERKTVDDQCSLDIQDRLSRSLSRAMTNCGLSRYQIAGRMSHLVGHEIKKSTIDAWTAESKKKWRIPAEYLPAFCVVTGSMEPLEIINDTTGLFTLPGPDVLRAEIQKLNEEEKRVKAEKRKHELFLKEMER